jgi:hypothetical protein
MGFNTSNKAKDFIKRLITAVKFLMFKRSSVNQNAINDNYSFDVFWYLHKKNGENHNFVGTLEILFIKNGGFICNRL